jgi:hypothetical protein
MKYPGKTFVPTCYGNSYDFGIKVFYVKGGG